MFYHLFYPLSSEYSIFNVFKYITFRSAYSGVTALTLSLILGNLMIQMLQKFQIGEKIRNDGPERHASKSGTPTMGGLIIVPIGLIIGNLFTINSNIHDQILAIAPYIEVSKYLEKEFSYIELNAGHDLNLDNLDFILKKIPSIKEVSIGHALVCDTIEFGLKETIEKYKAITQQ